MLNKLKALREEHEDGFTLIELLVVILIIGILASIAIPVFLNQRQTANDGAVKSDIRNVATSIETALISNPSGAVVQQRPIGTTTGKPGVCVVATASTTCPANSPEIKLSEGVTVVVAGSANSYTIRAWHSNGKKYTANTTGATVAAHKFALYESANGGLVN